MYDYHFARICAVLEELDRLPIAGVLYAALRQHENGVKASRKDIQVLHHLSEIKKIRETAK